MPSADRFVSVIAPLYRDADILESFVDELVACLEQHYVHFEVVLVDDASGDTTVELAQGLLQRHRHLRLLELSRTFGQEIAISAGLDTVIGDFVVVMLPESDPVERVPEMIELCAQGKGIVFGVRRSRAGEPWLQRTGARLFYGLCNGPLAMGIPRNATHFRAMSRQAVNAVIRIKERTRFLRTLSAYVGYGEQGIEYDPRPRRAQPRRKSLSEAAGLAIDIVVANTTSPLRWLACLAFLAGSLNGLYVLYVLGIFAFKDRVAEGWATRSLQASGSFLVIFLVLAVLCEYLARMLEEVKDRPLYYVQNESQSSVLVDDDAERNVVSQSESR